jgi:hypothetical protein
VLFVQERMDNTAAGASVSSYMASAKFNGQFHFPAGSDTQALLEQIRASAVPSQASQHKEVVIQTNFDSAELALVTPLYRGRAGSSPEAEALRAVLKTIVELSYEHIVEESEGDATEVSAEKKELLEANVTKLPLGLAVKLGLTDALGDRHQVTSSRAAKNKKKKKKQKQKATAANSTRSVLVMPADFQGTREEYFAAHGELTKQGKPKAKPGRKPGTKIINGKSLTPAGSLPPTPMTSISYSSAAPDSGAAAFLGTGTGTIAIAEVTELRGKLEEREQTIAEMREEISQLKAVNAQNVTTMEKKDAELRGELRSRKRVADGLLPVAQMTVAGLSNDDSFSDPSPLKLKKSCAETIDIDLEL